MVVTRENPEEKPQNMVHQADANSSEKSRVAATNEHQETENDKTNTPFPSTSTQNTRQKEQKTMSVVRIKAQITKQFNKLHPVYDRVDNLYKEIVRERQKERREELAAEALEQLSHADELLTGI